MSEQGGGYYGRGGHPRVLKPVVERSMKLVAIVGTCALVSVFIFGGRWFAEGMPGIPEMDVDRFKHLSSIENNEAKTPDGLCSRDFPKLGTATGNNEWYQHQQFYSMASFSNESEMDLFLELVQADRTLVSVAIPSYRSTAIQLPIGEYAVRVRAGKMWCPEAGVFRDEEDFESVLALSLARNKRTSAVVLREGAAIPYFSLEVQEHVMAGEAWRPRSTTRVEMLTAKALSGPKGFVPAGAMPSLGPIPIPPDAKP